MSDTNYASVAQNLKNIDVIDDEWLLDTLSDDEIDVRKPFDSKNDEEDEEDPQVDADDVWDDLGIDAFASDEAQRTGAGSSVVAPAHAQLQTNSSSQTVSANQSMNN